MSENEADFRLESIATPKKLVLLDDSPAGADGPASVAFSHELYADVLRDILLCNRGGICLGFFARWGQGKSTVINLLNNVLGKKARLVVFNAYQARGDSVRRQMLLSILRSIAPTQARDFERFSHTITPLELASAEQQEHFSERNIVKLLFLEKKLDLFLVGSAIIAIICAVIFAIGEWQVLAGITTFSSEHDLLIWLAGIVVACVAFCGRKFQERKASIIAYTQPASESQRLKYPEQFAQVFSDSVEKFCKETGKRLILVVDDLDRCEPGTVVEALACVRQFCHGAPGVAFDCQFLIPCDEGKMISALESDGYALSANHREYHNYSDTEMLRKFFDIVVRMDEIVPESMADFAAEEAGKVGVSLELARDMVDAAGIREPRKVKSLLNAFRISQEIVLRNQAQGWLPDLSQLERFEYTLALLVSFQELAPIAFAAVKENPEILLQARLPDNVEQIAQRIFASLSPVSATTADVLITKQIEPSLRGLPQAHALPAADRAGRVEEVVKLLSEAALDDQRRLLGWVCRKIRDARSGVRVRQLLTYILDFGSRNGWDAPALRPVASVLNRKASFLPEGLRLGNRFKSWGEYCSFLAPASRAFYNGIVLENYLASPESQPDEEKFLLRYSDSLTKNNAQRLRDSLFSGIFNNGVSHRLEAIANNLPEDETGGAYGFAPKIAECLFKALVDNRNLIGVDRHYHCLRVGLRFMGGDTETANYIFEHVLEKLSVFNSPVNLNEPSFLNGVYFEVLRGLLVSQSSFDKFDSFFSSKMHSWLNSQQNGLGRLKMLYYIQPGFGFLSDPSIRAIGSTVGQWFWEDEAFAKEGVARIDIPSRDDAAWLKKRELLREAIFAGFRRNVGEQANLSSAAKVFLFGIKAAGWNIQEPAEIILSDKVRRLSQNSGGRPNNVIDWCDLFIPLCAPGLPVLSKTTREILPNTVNPQELIRFALATLWENSIPSDFATALADTLIRHPSETLGSDAIGNTFILRSGFSEVARVLLTHIPGKGVEWMQSNSAFMSRLSDFVLTDAKLAPRYQSVIDALLTSVRDDYFKSGLQLLSKHQKIILDVKSSIRGWIKTKSESDPMAIQAIEICQRPDF